MTDEDSSAPPESSPPPPSSAGGPGWSVREPRPRPVDPWQVRTSSPAPPTFHATAAAPAAVPPALQPAAAPPPVAPRPAAPAVSAPVPSAPALPPRPPVPGGAPAPDRFPTNRQVGAIGLAAAVVIAGLGVYLFRGHSTSTAPAVISAPPDGAVAVVHNGPAQLVAEALTGGHPGQSLSLPGSPSTIVTTRDGTKGYLLDTTHGDVIPVDLAHGAVLTPIPVGKLPVDEQLSPDGRTLYVVDNLAGSLIPIDTGTNRPGPAQSLGQGIASFTKSPAGPMAVVSLYGDAGQPGVIAFYNTTTGAASGVAVGLDTPMDPTYTPDGATVWVTESGVGNRPGVVIPVDARSRAVGAPIAVGHRPASSAMTPDGHLLVVSNTLDRSVSIVDLTRHAVVATVPVGAAPERVVISADGATAWVANVLDRSLISVDLRTHRAGATVQLNNAPADLTLPSAGGQAWVLFPTSAGHVNFLNAQGTFGHSLGIGNQSGLIIASDSTIAWAVNTLSDSVQHVDMYGESVGAPIRVPRAPSEAVLTPDHHTLLVLSFGDGTQPGFLTAVDTRTSKASAPLAVGVAPSDLTLSPDGAIAYIDNHQSNAVAVVDIGLWRVRGALALPCSPSQLVITPDGTELFANCNASAAVIPIHTHDLSVGAPIAVAPSPTLVMSSQGKVVIVVANHVLQEIDPGTGTVVLTHEETGNIVSLLPTPDDNTLVALENTGGAVLLIHTATLVTTSSIAVGSRPDILQLTRNGARAYVLDTGKQKLYVIDVTGGKLASTLDVSPNASSVIVPSQS